MPDEAVSSNSSSLELDLTCDSEPSFADIIRQEWQTFNRHDGKDSQAMELASSHLSRSKGHNLDRDINAAMSSSILYRLFDLKKRLSDDYKRSIDPSLALLAEFDIVETRSFDFVDFWIERGADVNAPSVMRRPPYDFPQGSTPLHLAAYSGSVALARALLQHDTQIDVKDDRRLPPLLRLSENLPQ